MKPSGFFGPRPAAPNGRGVAKVLLAMCCIAGLVLVPAQLAGAATQANAKRQERAARRNPADAPFDRLVTKKTDGDGHMITFEGFGAAHWGETVSATITG